MESIKVRKQKLIYDIRNLCSQLDKEFDKETYQSKSYGKLVQIRADLHQAIYKIQTKDQRTISEILKYNCRFISPDEFKYLGWMQLRDWEVMFIEHRTGKDLEEHIYEDYDGDDDNGKPIIRLMYSYKLTQKS